MIAVCVKTPFGYVRVDCSDTAIHSLEFDGCAKESQLKSLSGVPRQVFMQIKAYCDDASLAFTLPLQAEGSQFQLRVWQALRGIPYGQTVSYGQQAVSMGEPGAARAVGAANGRNPLSIVVPCHRVVSASGSLTGFAGGVMTKAWLLDHEGRVLAGG